MKRRGDPWAGLAWDMWAMGLEASSVIGLRALKIAAGGAAAEAEIKLMVSEKAAASLTLPMLAMTGQLGVNGAAVTAGSLSYLRKKVRANRRRLARG